MKISDDKGSVAEQVCGVLSEYSRMKINDHSGAMRIADDLGLDSFSVVEIVYELEMRFNIKVTNEDLKEIKTVNDVISIAEHRMRN